MEITKIHPVKEPFEAFGKVCFSLYWQKVMINLLRLTSKCTETVLAPVPAPAA